MPEHAQEEALARTLNVYWIGGAKGGVGKSLASMAFLDFLGARGVTPVLVETDTSNPDVGKSYGTTVETELLDLDSRDGWLALLTLCEQSEHPIVINTGSRNSAAVTQYADLFALGLDELGAELVALWVINEHRDSLELLRQFRSSLPRSRVHVLRNQHCSSSFPLYEASQIRQDIEAAGGKSLTFPELANRVTRELYERRLTLQAATREMPFGSRIELKRWRREVGEVFSQVVA
jgi:hypothetical protein